MKKRLLSVALLLCMLLSLLPVTAYAEDAAAADVTVEETLPVEEAADESGDPEAEVVPAAADAVPAGETEEEAAEETTTEVAVEEETVSADAMLQGDLAEPASEPVVLSKPVIDSAKNGAAGVVLSWGAVEGATAYTVQRKANGESKWSTLGTFEEAGYTDTAVKSNTKYTYRVRAVAGGTNSKYSASKSITAYLPPVLKKAAIAATGVKLTWGKVAGAASYRVYRWDEANQKWAQAAKSVTATNYTDTKAVSGAVNQYKVRALNSSGKLISVMQSEGISCYYIARPTVSSAKIAYNGVTVKWKAVDGAEGYRILRKTAKTDWAEVGTTDGAPLSFTDTEGLKNKTKYTYTVQAVGAEGVLSKYNTTGKSLTYYKSPALTEITATSKGYAKLTWEKVAGAAKYQVYYKTNAEASWKKLTVTSNLTYPDKKAQYGYLYTVDALNSSGTLISGKDPSGLLFAEPARTSALDQILAEGLLRVAMSPDFEPMEFLDESKTGQDRFLGFDVYLAKYIAQELSVELELVEMDFDACQEAVLHGEVPMSISAYTGTDERAGLFELSQPYYSGEDSAENYMVILMPKGETELRDAVNTAMSTAHAAGCYEAWAELAVAEADQLALQNRYTQVEAEFVATVCIP